MCIRDRRYTECDCCKHYDTVESFHYTHLALIVVSEILFFVVQARCPINWPTKKGRGFPTLCEDGKTTSLVMLRMRWRYLLSTEITVPVTNWIYSIETVTVRIPRAPKKRWKASKDLKPLGKKWSRNPPKGKAKSIVHSQWRYPWKNWNRPTHGRRVLSLTLGITIATLWRVFFYICLPPRRKPL